MRGRCEELVVSSEVEDDLAADEIIERLLSRIW